MLSLKAATIGNGSINYVKEYEGRPETKEQDGNVTIINKAIPAIHAHYQASFMINSEFEIDQFKCSNIFHLNCIVAERNDHAPYRSVEDRAARQLAPMLRLLADKLEADLPNFSDQAVETKG